ncbi:DNA cytosine methyltransferase [Pseudomonas nunensis]|uniref:DNA cytosine methyltransferase n=1 Tax=Pseudomonas nunensis TaxID=2961896 RepID=UPI0034D2B272
MVLENVVNLAINDSQDFETVIRALEDCGYVGLWRVLNAQYFGVPSNVVGYSWSQVIDKCPH